MSKIRDAGWTCPFHGTRHAPGEECHLCKTGQVCDPNWYLGSAGASEREAHEEAAHGLAGERDEARSERDRALELLREAWELLDMEAPNHPVTERVEEFLIADAEDERRDVKLTADEAQTLGHYASSMIVMDREAGRLTDEDETELLEMCSRLSEPWRDDEEDER